MKVQWLMVLSADMLPAEAHTDGEPVLSTVAAVDTVAHFEPAADGTKADDAGNWAAVHSDDEPDAAAAADGQVAVTPYAAVVPAVVSHIACRQAAAGAVYHSMGLAGQQPAAL